MFPFTIEGIVRSLVYQRQLKYGYNETPVFVVESTMQIAPVGSVFYVVTPFGEDATITRAFDIFGNQITALNSKVIVKGVDFIEQLSAIQFSAPSAGCFVHLKIMNVLDFSSPFVNLIAPVVSGTLTVGSTLSVTNGTYTKTTTFTYQWYLDAVAVSGATANTYLTTDAGSVYCAVTATDPTNGSHINTNSNTVTVTV